MNMLVGWYIVFFDMAKLAEPFLDSLLVDSQT
jgi:hypothetical protein